MNILCGLTSTNTTFTCATCNVFLACSWSESGEHKLTVTATDTTGKFSIQQVLLVVQAVQNIPPTFPYQVEQIQVPETLQKGSQVLTVKGTLKILRILLP